MQTFLIPFFISILILYNVRFTDIDYTTYIAQSGMFLNGERDYLKIRGDSGPLVYPALHLYIYSLLSYSSLYTSQIIFAFMHAFTIYLVSAIYGKVGVKNLPLLLLFSKRLYSIYVLRCFNDCVGMLFMYLSIYYLINRKFQKAAILYSLSLGIKMNVFLFAPAYAFIYLVSIGLVQSFLCGLLVLGVQLVIAIPFLDHWKSYLLKAFELGRVFEYQWTVNWKFIPESIFLSRDFHVLLLVLHATLLCFFFWKYSSKRVLNSKGIHP
jgi:alpha-1,3-mannosyltransferase